MVDGTQLKVGDKVLVSTTASFTGSCKGAWAGKVMTIRSIRYNDFVELYQFRMVEDMGEANGHGWCWAQHQLDYYDGSEYVIITPGSLHDGMEVILRNSQQAENNRLMTPFFGQTVTVHNVFGDYFFIEEDSNKNIWHYTHIARIVDPAAMQVSQVAFDDFLENVVGKID